MTYAAALLAAVREVVSDPVQLSAIASRIHRLVGRESEVVEGVGKKRMDTAPSPRPTSG